MLKALSRFTVLLYGMLVQILIYSCTTTVLAKSTDNDDSSNAIIGAGAHFSWIVFDELKQELEEISGRKLELFGQGSLMGIGCNAGIKSAQKSLPDKESFGFTCCPISDEEIKEKEIIVHPIALEPILIVVNKENPVSNLSSEQVSAIFRGDIVNWKEVGGIDKPLIVVARLHCKDRSGHWKKILPKAEEFTQMRLDVKSAEAMVDKVNKLPNAIGHIGSAWRFKDDNQVKILKINNYLPTSGNLKNKKYPYYRELSAVTNKFPSDSLMKIINHAQTSKTLQKISEKYNLLPLANP